MREIPKEQLQIAFSYVDGKFFWNLREGSDRETRRFNTCFAGKEVRGVLDRYGYLTIQLNKVRVKYHRAVFAYHFGYYPETVDHINGVRDDNRVENLRAANKSEQQWNKLGVVGCYRKGSRWRASIKSSGKRIYLGSFATQVEASEAYKSAKARLHTLKYSDRV